MRRSAEEAAKTRNRIVREASRLFRERGFAAVSVADVMSACGLTVGGFYRHFDSKDALVAEALESASRESTRRQIEQQRKLGPARRLETIDAYLSMDHRNAAGAGCPVAALCSEVAREVRTTKEAFTVALQRLLGSAVALQGRKGERADDESLFLTSAIVGALVLSRGTDDLELARRILDATRHSVRDRLKSSP